MTKPELSDIKHEFGKGGLSVKLTFETRDGATFPVELSHENLTKLIDHLTRVAASAAAQRTGGRSVLFSEQRPRNPSATFPSPPISGVSFAATPDGNDQFLVIRLWDTDLLFQVTTTTIESMEVAFREWKEDREKGVDKLH